MMEEKTVVLFQNEKMKIERIFSYGLCSAVDFWYDNCKDEWVIIIEGNAVLELEDRKISLKTGDSYFIEAHKKHRVAKTSLDCQWLCVHVNETSNKCSS